MEPGAVLSGLMVTRAAGDLLLVVRVIREE